MSATQLEESIVWELAGFWKDDRSTDEIIADIYSSRTSNNRIAENFGTPKRGAFIGRNWVEGR
jgi:hypothetical protein